jgi:hypothetical protein
MPSELEIIDKLLRITEGQDTRLKPGVHCCECGKPMVDVLGEGTPFPGAAIMCGECGCLSIFDEDLNVRAPVDDEIFLAAKDPVIQAARRAILEFNRLRGKAAAG